MLSVANLNIKNKKVLIRVDYNVPINKGVIINDYRIKSSIETINYCLSQNCSVVLMSHLGRPIDNNDQYSLNPVLEYLEEYFNTYIHFSDDCISNESIEISNNLLPREIHLLENLRYYKQEINNDVSFAKKLSKHADVYICDSFGTSHRKHASNSAILSFFKYKSIGFLMSKELKYLKNNLSYKNLTIVIGGAKISSKLKMIKYFINNCRNIIIGGAMVFTILKSLNKKVGRSLVENDMLEESKEIFNKIKSSSTKLLLPDDIVCENDKSKKITLKNINDISDDEVGLDIGPETLIKYTHYIKNSDCIIWNGPMGKFEDLSFAVGTHTLSEVIANCGEHITTIIGGGDTVSAIEMTQSLDSFTHVSTGGGASLKLLSGEKLDFQNSWEEYE